jgi:hypothetical protein
VSPEEGVLYTPEEVSKHRWLDGSPGALRKAVERKQIECTRYQGRIYFTRANIFAIQAAGYQPAGADKRARPGAARRARRVPAEAGQAGVTTLRPRPQDRRRGRRAS